MCIAYSLTRLVLLEAERNIDIDFRPGIEALQRKPWSSMEPLRANGSGQRGARGVA